MSENDEQRRLKRIDDCLANALRQQDPLQANLGTAGSDLMRISHRLQQVIERGLSKDDRTEYLDKLTPTIDLQLRVLRQIDRLARLQQRGVTHSQLPHLTHAPLLSHSTQSTAADGKAENRHLDTQRPLGGE